MFKKELEQNRVYEFFEKVFQTKKLVRSYLFLGDNKADKNEFAYELAQLLNCEVNKRIWLDKIGNTANQNTLFAIEEANYKEACGSCQSCLWLNEKSHPKTPVFIEGSGKKMGISVDTARALNEELMQSSEYFRIIVFEDATMNTLKRDSANILLKSVEEANPNTMFLFFADSKENVLPTIVSRCQQICFKPGANVQISEDIQELLEKIRRFVNSNEIKDELQRMSFSEELAQEERDLLIKAFGALQNEFVTTSLDLDNSNSILICEELIYDLKSFVKVKSAIKSCFDKLSRLEFSFEFA